MKIGRNRIMNMKTRYIFLTIATLALSACVKNTEPSEPEGMQMTFTAYQEGSEMTRTTVQDGGTQVYWEPSDEIKVFFNGSSGRFVSQNSENATVATFTGTINVVAGANGGGNASYTTWGLYPYRADATSDGSSVTTTLPAEQTGRAGSFAKNTNITVAQSSGLNLAFYNVCGGVRFSLTQEGIKRVTFEGNNEETIAGKIKVAFADGIPVVQEISEGEKMITLTAPNGGTFQTGQWYYISAIPGSLSKGHTMTFYKESESAKLTSSSPVTFKRGIFGSLADADEDLMFKPSGSGDEPNPDNYIRFSDPVAKYACVAKFDTNGDGEISIEEAEAVTSFNGLFADWNTVASFEEICYFKNVKSIDYLFYGCSKLVSITIPSNITDLGERAFYGCSSLTSIVIPSGITTIGDYTFFGCTSLVSVDIPSSVTSIGQYAFSSCLSLDSIILPSALKYLGQHAFSSSGLTQISIPDGVTTLNRYTFYNCSKLTTINIPYGISSIPEFCFNGCISLTSVSIPEGVTSIGYSAFSGVKMWKIELPSSISSLGHSCFGGIVCVILPSTSPISIQSTTFSDVAGVFVPSNMIPLYCVMTNWSQYASLIRPLESFREREVFTLASTGTVDMGTSVKWAAYNVGATKPEEYGDSFAWGETQTKTNYSWKNYFDSPNGDTKLFTKYFNGEGGKTKLDLEDDVAHVRWGNNWRMPTNEEWIELSTVCIWEWTTYEGVSGCMVYDFEGLHKLFFPAAGYYYYSEQRERGSDGFYWSSSLGSGDSRFAQCMVFTFDHYVSLDDGNRNLGYSIRPVCP